MSALILTIASIAAENLSRGLHVGFGLPLW